MPAPTLAPERVSVVKFELNEAIEFVRKLPCTEMRCKNAGSVGTTQDPEMGTADQPSAERSEA
jgi:hypothetical protein